MEKKILKTVLFAIFLSVFIIPYSESNAKEYEECYHCKMTGAYHCKFCNDTGGVFCRDCVGKGGYYCPYCDGKGYMVCSSCNGDTYIRTGEGDIPKDAEPGTCGNCNGTGKVDCIICHNEGWIKCITCNETGYEKCHNQECEKARANNGVCTYCQGTKYMVVGIGMKPEWNDGVNNIPKEGELIWRNDQETTYRYHKTPTAAESKKAKEELEAYKSKALENIAKVFNTYSESYYTKKEYKKLKSIYDNCVKAIDEATTIEEVNKAYYKNKAKLQRVRPSKLDKYLIEMQYKIRKECHNFILGQKDPDHFDPNPYYMISGEYCVKVAEATSKSKAKKLMKKACSMIR